MGFLLFMASTAGRALRIIVGLILIVWGISMRSTGGIILAIIGLAPLGAGALDRCLLAPLFGYPFKGKGIRALGESKLRHT